MTPELPRHLWPLFFRLATGEEAPSAMSPERLHGLLTLATEEGLLALLFDERSFPEALRGELDRATAIRSLYRKRLELHVKAASAVVEALGPDGCLFVKGFDYRFRLYPRPELRPSADIDVYVPDARVSEAVARLRAAGHRVVPCEAASLWGSAFYEVGVDVGEVRVEIHRTFGHPLRTAVDYGGVWEMRESFVAGGIEARRLCPLHAMGLHVLNLNKEELAAPLVRLVDLFLMLRLWPQLVAPLADLSRAWGIERGLYGSLRVSTALFPELETDEIVRVRDGLLTPGTRRFLDRFVLPDRRRNLSGQVDGRAVQVWRKFWLTDGVARRTVFFGWAAWRHLLDAFRVRSSPLVNGPAGGVGT